LASLILRRLTDRSGHLLSDAYYRRQASRALKLAGTATTPAIKNRLGEVARECDRLADLVDVAASNILADQRPDGCSAASELETGCSTGTSQKRCAETVKAVLRF
jgi:hypothetical protein